MGLPKTVLFIGTANYYRSRFAECLFNALAEESGLHWAANSRGVNLQVVDDQGPISGFVAEWLAARHIRLDKDIRFPIPLTENDLACADLVIAMNETEHRAMMLEQFPFWADTINYWAIDDIDCRPPEESLPECQACVETLVEGLMSEQKITARTRKRLAA